MEIVQRVKTFDGKVHDSVEKALHYLEAMHADQLSKIAHAICQLNAKYVPTGEWIDNNLGRFLDLHAIKQDMVVVNDAED